MRGLSNLSLSYWKTNFDYQTVNIVNYPPKLYNCVRVFEMPKSTVIKQLANNEIPLNVGLSRLLIIASDINDDLLVQWAESELNGYVDDKTVPQYRIVEHGQYIYSGINGNYQVTNGPLPALDLLHSKIKDDLPRNIFNENVSSIEKYSQSSHGVGKDVSFLSDFVYDRFGIQCFNINILFQPQVFSQMISEIKTKLIKIFIRLEKEFGCLDNLDINVQGRNMGQIQNEIHLIIYQDNSTSIGDKNKINGSLFGSKKEG